MNHDRVIWGFGDRIGPRGLRKYACQNIFYLQMSLNFGILYSPEESKTGLVLNEIFDQWMQY
jgi:hypothetical protein